MSYSSFYPQYNRRTPFTRIRIYDVRNRALPYLLKEYAIEGKYFNGRKTRDGFIYILARQNLYRRTNPAPWYNFGLNQAHLGFGNIFYYPHQYRTPIFLNIFSFNLRNPYSQQLSVRSILTEDAQQLYMSERHIYITFTQNQKTVIHKIFVYGTWIVPFADGLIEGRVNNQFWMDEFGPFLRISSTDRSQNRVYCLNYFLRVYGYLGGIAPT